MYLSENPAVSSALEALSALEAEAKAAAEKEFDEPTKPFRVYKDRTNCALLLATAAIAKTGLDFPVASAALSFRVVPIKQQIIGYLKTRGKTISTEVCKNLQDQDWAKELSADEAVAMATPALVRACYPNAAVNTRDQIFVVANHIYHLARLAKASRSLKKGYGQKSSFEIGACRLASTIPPSTVTAGIHDKVSNLLLASPQPQVVNTGSAPSFPAPLADAQSLAPAASQLASQQAAKEAASAALKLSPLNSSWGVLPALPTVGTGTSEPLAKDFSFLYSNFE